MWIQRAELTQSGSKTSIFLWSVNLLLANPNNSTVLKTVILSVSMKRCQWTENLTTSWWKIFKIQILEIKKQQQNHQTLNHIWSIGTKWCPKGNNHRNITLKKAMLSGEIGGKLPKLVRLSIWKKKKLKCRAVCFNWWLKEWGKTYSLGKVLWILPYPFKYLGLILICRESPEDTFMLLFSLKLLLKRTTLWREWRRFFVSDWGSL